MYEVWSRDRPGTSAVGKAENTRLFRASEKELM